METWIQVGIGFGGFVSPIILAAMARDRFLMNLIASNRDEVSKMVNASSTQLHERVNRVRDEFVRRDDFETHMVRLDKHLDDMRGELRRQSEKTDQRLDAILKQLQGKTRSAQ